MSKPNIFVVDDEPDMVKGLVLVLREIGEVGTAPTAEEALEYKKKPCERTGNRRPHAGDWWNLPPGKGKGVSPQDRGYSPHGVLFYRICHRCHEEGGLSLRYEAI